MATSTSSMNPVLRIDGSSASYAPERPSWAPRTVLVYRAARPIPWSALLALATFLLIAAIAFTAFLLMRHNPELLFH